MNTATTSVEVIIPQSETITVSARVIGEISSAAVATTTAIVSEPTFWETVLAFLTFWN